VRRPARAFVAVCCAGALSACATSAGVSRPAGAAAGRPSAPTSQAVVRSALSLRGTPYRFGGTTPESGFDCSGFVAYVLARNGMAMPRSTAEQFAVGKPVAHDRMRPGDLIFFATAGPGATHVGIVTDAGRGEFVHAPADGSRVRVDRFDAEYWRRRWVGARRVF